MAELSTAHLRAPFGAEGLHGGPLADPRIVLARPQQSVTGEPLSTLNFNHFRLMFQF